MSAKTTREYVSRRRITAETGINARRVVKLAEAGLIGVEAIPGTHPRYCLQDVLDLTARYRTVGKFAEHGEPMMMAS